MKLRDWLKKFRRQDEEDERSSDSVNEAWTVGSGENPASWIPSQQEGPRH